MAAMPRQISPAVFFPLVPSGAMPVTIADTTTPTMAKGMSKPVQCTEKRCKCRQHSYPAAWLMRFPVKGLEMTEVKIIRWRSGTGRSYKASGRTKPNKASLCARASVRAVLISVWSAALAIIYKSPLKKLLARECAY